MNRIIVLLSTLVFIILFIVPAIAQDTTATTGGNNQIIDLSERATILKIEPEKPRVNIFSDRIKPEFDNVHLERSFLPEISGQGEKIILSAQKEETARPEFIDVEKVLKRKR